MTTCEECGAAVADLEKHEGWHSELDTTVDGIRSTADDALDRAEQAQNTLYQNGIEV